MLRKRFFVILAIALFASGALATSVSFFSSSKAFAAASMCPSGTAWLGGPGIFNSGAAKAPDLSYGSTDASTATAWNHNWVSTLQRSLNEAYRDPRDPFHNGPYNFNPPLAVDGIFGPNTHNAVLDYQIARPPLAVDGIAGPLTFDSLGICINV